MRLIDADALENEFGISDEDIIAKEAIRDAHTIDAVPVVRCKDCKHYKEFRTKQKKQVMKLCYRMGKHDMEYFVKPNDFCSYGERKEGADNG